MTADARVEELLAQALERRERGQAVDALELAGGDAELARALTQALERGAEIERRLAGAARVGRGAPAGTGAVGSGARIGPYVVLDEIARGGMGRVLLAEDTRAPDEPGGSRPRVALKLLDGLGAIGPRGRERFSREAAILRGLEHPGVVRILDADVERDVPWIAMEHVEGETLAAVLARARASGRGPTRPFSPTQAASIGARLARAVEAVHRAGVLHRDIKPANVILTAHERVVLVDFGLVREEGTATLTRTGDLLGTPQYMAPEQARGERADERTDVYGIGAVLYELLALRAPHGAPPGASGAATDPLHVLAEVRRRSAEPLARVAPEVPRELERVVTRALAFRRARRTPTAAAVARDLEAFVAGEPVVARRTGALERLDELWRRQRARLPIAAALVLGIAAVVLGARWIGERARDERRALLAEALASWVGKDEAGALRAARALAPADERFAPLLVAVVSDEPPPASDDAAVSAAARGWSAVRAGRHDEGLDELRDARELAPDDPVPVVLLARAAELAGDFELAAREYRGAVERLPHAGFHARLSYAHYKLGNAREAEQEIRAAIVLAPTDADHRFAHARVLGVLERSAEALAEAERGATLAGDAATKTQLQILSTALDRAERHADSRAVLRRVLERWPDDRQVLYNLQHSLQLDHELAEALAVCEELAGTKDRPIALASMAWILCGSDRATCAACAEAYARAPELLDADRAEELALEALALGGPGQVPLVVGQVGKILGRPARIRTALEGLQAVAEEDARIALLERALRPLRE